MTTRDYYLMDYQLTKNLKPFRRQLPPERPKSTIVTQRKYHQKVIASLVAIQIVLVEKTNYSMV